MILHPNAERLLRYADSEATPAEYDRLSDHLARCDACSSTVSDTREVITLLRHDAGVAPEWLLDSVITSRTHGARVMLPLLSVEAPPRQSNRRLWLVAGVGIAASALLWMVPFTSRSDEQAQSPAPADSALRQTLVAPPTMLDPSRIHPVTVWYEAEYQHSYPTYPPNAPPTIQVYRIRVEALPTDTTVWLVLTDNGDTRFMSRDSLFLRRSDLRPMRSVAASKRHGMAGVRLEYLIGESELSVHISGSSLVENGEISGAQKTLDYPLPSPLPAPLVLDLGGQFALLMALDFRHGATEWSTTNLGGLFSMRSQHPRPLLQTTTYSIEQRAGGGLFGPPRNYILSRRGEGVVGETRYRVRESDGLLMEMLTVSGYGDTTRVRATSIR